MKSLYKYMPLDSLLKFLDDPCLRITPSFCQNDPFEFGYSNVDLEKLNLISKTGNLGDDLKDYSNLHGIISLSSTYKNILMWSHYADNHSGAVVEFFINENKPLDHFINNVNRGLHPTLFDSSLFNEVIYSEERPFNVKGNLINLELIKQHYYFTKAKPWVYEDEYRFILPASLVSKIIFSQEGLEMAKKLSNRLLYAKCLNPETESTNRKYIIDGSDISLINSELLIELWKLSKGKDIMFFIRVNTGTPGHNSGCIGKIYLGCKVEEEKLISKLRNDKYSDFGIHRFYYSINPQNMYEQTIQNIFKGYIHKNEYKLKFNCIERTL